MIFLHKISYFYNNGNKVQQKKTHTHTHTHNQECKNNYITHLIHCRSLSNLTIQKTLSYLINIECFSVFSLIY